MPKLTRFHALSASLMLLMMTPDVHAEAGRVLFVFGNAAVEYTDGSTTNATKGLAVESGDRVVTSVNGRVQIRMADGGLIALRPNSEFLIESFSYTPPGQASTSAAPQPDQSFYRLLKGGFRSVTGAVGKADKSAYQVETPVATIGIRGTDYTAVYCDSICDASRFGQSTSAPAGLYLGVSEGGVTLKNAGGSLNVDAGQNAYVADPNTLPMIVAKASGGSSFAANEAEGEEEEEETQVSVPSTATDQTGQEVDLTEGENLVNPEPGSVAVAAGPLGTADSFSGVTTGDEARLVVDVDGNLTQFQGPFPDPSMADSTVVAEYGVGTSQIIDRGEDPMTDIRWGRWSTGVISVTDSSGQQDVDLGPGSLHWITGSVGETTPAIPTTGSLNFTLIGNTNPTDNAGNVGSLGFANLSADFTNQTVDADVSLSIGATNQIWDASAQDVDINSSAASFQGQFDTVTITDTVTSGTSQGTGDLAGFFSADETGVISGAGIGYSMDDGAGTSVSGAAAFQADPGGN